MPLRVQFLTVDELNKHFTDTFFIILIIVINYNFCHYFSKFISDWVWYHWWVLEDEILRRKKGFIVFLFSSPKYWWMGESKHNIASIRWNAVAVGQNYDGRGLLDRSDIVYRSTYWWHIIRIYHVSIWPENSIDCDDHSNHCNNFIRFLFIE